MPQAKRSPAESVEFKHMLKHANLLYLGTRVLILLDLSYIGRFWTLFEAWLSMQMVTPEGLKPATLDQNRFDIVPVHGANKITGESLKNMWAERTPQDAYDLLKEPDVTVTNQSDKEIQLVKLLQLDEEVREAMRATNLADTCADMTMNMDIPVAFREGNADSTAWTVHGKARRSAKVAPEPDDSSKLSGGEVTATEAFMGEADSALAAAPPLALTLSSMDDDPNAIEALQKEPMVESP